MHAIYIFGAQQNSRVVEQRLVDDRPEPTSGMVHRKLQWRRIEDPPGAWALLAGQVPIAELCWSREEKSIRVEVGDEVWRCRSQSRGVIRAILSWGEPEVAQVLFAGNLRRGVVLFRDGARFLLTLGRDREHGLWAGFDDMRGEATVRVQARVGGGSAWSEVACSPLTDHLPYVKSLAVLWGCLRLLRLRQPWLILLSPGLTYAVAEREVLALGATVAS